MNNEEIATNDKMLFEQIKFSLGNQFLNAVFGSRKEFHNRRRLICLSSVIVLMF